MRHGVEATAATDAPKLFHVGVPRGLGERTGKNQGWRGLATAGVELTFFPPAKQQHSG